MNVRFNPMFWEVFFSNSKEWAIFQLFKFQSKGMDVLCKYLEPNWPLLNRPCFAGLTFKNRGHLSSRYVLFITFWFYLGSDCFLSSINLLKRSIGFSPEVLPPKAPPTEFQYSGSALLLKRGGSFRWTMVVVFFFLCGVAENHLVLFINVICVVCIHIYLW